MFPFPILVILLVRKETFCELVSAPHGSCCWVWASYFLPQVMLNYHLSSFIVAVLSPVVPKLFHLEDPLTYWAIGFGSTFGATLHGAAGFCTDFRALMAGFRCSLESHSSEFENQLLNLSLKVLFSF